jgi:excisionase family DNA binding protein
VEKLLNKKEAAALFGISERTLDRWRAQGLITAFKRGGIVRFREVDIERLVVKLTKPDRQVA